MAIVVTIGGNDLTAKTNVKSVIIEQSAMDMVATCTLEIVDVGTTVSIASKDDITIVDGATDYFKGEVAGSPAREEQGNDTLIWYVECQDYNQLLNETVVTSYSEAAAAKSDATIVGDLVGFRGEADIDGATNVTEVVAQADMEPFSAYCTSLAQALSSLCEITGARFYVDFDKALWYFKTPATTNADGLKTSGHDDVDYFEAWGLKRFADVGIVNAVYVLGKTTAAWRTDAGSVGTYGSRELAIRDQDISTTDGLNFRGDAILAANKDPAQSYEIYTARAGFSPGEKVEITDTAHGLSDSAFYILKMETTWVSPNTPIFKLTCGDEIVTFAKYRQTIYHQIEGIEKKIGEVDNLEVYGWNHNIAFSATDNDTVAWAAAGTITTGGGGGTYTIDAGNTGNMAALTYIYLDIDTSTTVLQTTTTSATAVGANKIMICVAVNIADATKYAPYQVFGSSSPGGTFVTADYVVTDTLTANEIAANTITASEIAANTITASEIFAGTITATEITGTTLSAIYADMGTLTAGTINMYADTWDVDATGFRLNATEIASQASGTDQIVLSVATGLLTAGGGTVELSENGIYIDSKNATIPDSKNALIFDVAGTPYGQVANHWYSPGGGANDYIITELRGHDISGYDTSVRLIADQDAGQVADVQMIVTNIDLGVYDEGADDYAWLNGGSPRLFIDNSASWVDSTNMTVGLTIDQGANDDQIVVLRSSDVAHGATDWAETDAFGTMKKSAGTSGGLWISGLKDADGGAGRALDLAGYLAENPSTDKTTAAAAIVQVGGWQTSGTGRANTVADGNVFLVQTYRGGAAEAIVIIDEDGDIYHDGGLNAYDEEDDALALIDLKHVLTDRLERVQVYHPGRLQALGILGEGEGRPLISHKAVTGLLLGAIEQLYGRVGILERGLLEAEYGI